MLACADGRGRDHATRLGRHHGVHVTHDGFAARIPNGEREIVFRLFPAIQRAAIPIPIQRAVCLKGDRMFAELDGPVEDFNPSVANHLGLRNGIGKVLLVVAHVKVQGRRSLCRC